MYLRPTEAPKTEEVFSEGLERVLGVLEVVLVVWGGPWVGPGKSKCCYVVDISDVLGKQGFSLIFC